MRAHAQSAPLCLGGVGMRSRMMMRLVRPAFCRSVAETASTIASSSSKVTSICGTHAYLRNSPKRTQCGLASPLHNRMPPPRANAASAGGHHAPPPPPHATAARHCRWRACRHCHRRA
eukprot:2477413-Prymnesium_polylepis.1